MPGYAWNAADSAAGVYHLVERVNQCFANNAFAGGGVGLGVYGAFSKSPTAPTWGALGLVSIVVAFAVAQDKLQGNANQADLSVQLIGIGLGGAAPLIGHLANGKAQFVTGMFGAVVSGSTWNSSAHC